MWNTCMKLNMDSFVSVNEAQNFNTMHKYIIINFNHHFGYQKINRFFY